ncbi:MAG: Fe-S cluster assembly protein HesB [Planctomycetes bacterium]|nr:Fe-S cluster assembly protein HesB [Planctomycetota bacterium]
MAVRRFRIGVEPGFDLRLVAFSHGWVDLQPFGWSEPERALSVTVEVDRHGVDVVVRQGANGLSVVATSRRLLSAAQGARVRKLVTHMLRLDDDLEPFWRVCADCSRLAWAARRRAGRILRGASVFEDLMKLLFTTNCSWAATKLMTARLVDALGSASPAGRAFPSPQACAAQDEAFYREVVRAGYRAKSCVALARGFATGVLRDASFTAPDLTTEEVRRRLLALEGFGPYAAGQAMRTLGHYRDLALDSWCRARLTELLGSRRAPADRTVERRYAKYRPFEGLAMWLELTADWHAPG